MGIGFLHAYMDWSISIWADDDYLAKSKWLITYDCRTIWLGTAAGSTWRRKTRRWTSTRQRALWSGSRDVGRRCLWIGYYPRVISCRRTLQRLISATMCLTRVTRWPKRYAHPPSCSETSSACNAVFNRCLQICLLTIDADDVTKTAISYRLERCHSNNKLH